MILGVFVCECNDSETIVSTPYFYPRVPNTTDSQEITITVRPKAPPRAFLLGGVWSIEGPLGTVTSMVSFVFLNVV